MDEYVGGRCYGHNQLAMILVAASATGISSPEILHTV